MTNNFIRPIAFAAKNEPLTSAKAMAIFDNMLTEIVLPHL
jgi:hypothetical protein